MIKFLRYVTLLLLLYGCKGNQYNTSEISSSILVSYKFSQEVSSGNRADIVLTNTTDFCIVFPLIDGLRIYTEDDNEEKELKNLIDIIGDQNLILPPDGEPLSSRIVALRPDTSSIFIKEPVLLSIKLTGYLCDDSSIVIEKIIPLTIKP